MNVKDGSRKSAASHRIEGRRFLWLIRIQEGKTSARTAVEGERKPPPPPPQKKKSISERASLGLAATKGGGFRTIKFKQRKKSKTHPTKTLLSTT